MFTRYFLSTLAGGVLASMWWSFAIFVFGTEAVGLIFIPIVLSVIYFIIMGLFIVDDWTNNKL